MIENIKNLFRKKKIVSLNNFHDRVGKIAKEYGQDYYSVAIERCGHDGYKFRGYINGFTHLFGKSIDEVCEKLREYKKSSISNSENIKDVNIEIE